MVISADIDSGEEGRSLAVWVNSGARASCYAGRYGTGATTLPTFIS
jgi:hypothetical protein